jgi:hypothetical protein
MKGESATSSRSNNAIDHAVIVTGHAVMRLNKLSVADRNEDAWLVVPLNPLVNLIS